LEGAALGCADDVDARVGREPVGGRIVGIPAAVLGEGVLGDVVLVVGRVGLVGEVAVGRGGGHGGEVHAVQQGDGGGWVQLDVEALEGEVPAVGGLGRVHLGVRVEVDEDPRLG